MDMILSLNGERRHRRPVKRWEGRYLLFTYKVFFFDPVFFLFVTLEQLTLVQLRAGGYYDSRRRLQVCGGEEQDSTSGHVGKHPGNSVNHTMEARAEHLTVWKDGHEKNSGLEPRCDSVFESRKMTRTTGEKMDG